MLEFLSNSWVVGIGGGILSGLFVTFISNYFISKKDDKEYIRRVSQANSEVIYAIRPTISAGKLPSYEIIDALVSSSAEKYSVEKENMYTLEQICNNLIKEVMDSSLITSIVKSEYCSQLSELKKHNKTEIADMKSIEERIRNRKSELVGSMSISLGLVAAGITIFFAILDSKSKQSIDTAQDNVLWIVLAISTLVMLSVMIITTIKNTKNKKEESKKLDSK